MRVLVAGVIVALLQDAAVGPSVIDVQAAATHVAGTPGLLRVSLVDRIGRPILAGGSVVLTTTDPRSPLNSCTIPLTNGVGTLDGAAQFFTAGAHSIHARLEGGAALGRLDNLQINALPKDATIKLDPPPGCLSAGSVVKVTGTVSVGDVEVRVKLSKGARIFPSRVFADANGAFEFALYAGEEPVSLCCYIDLDNSGGVGGAEPCVDCGPIPVAPHCPLDLIAAARAELLHGCAVEPPPTGPIVVAAASPKKSDQAKIDAALRFLDEKVILFIASGEWNGRFSQVAQRLDHLAKFLFGVPCTERVIAHLSAASDILKKNKDVREVRLSIEDRPGRATVQVGATVNVEAQLFDHRGRAIREFHECTTPRVSATHAQGPGTAGAGSGLGYAFTCDGPGNVVLTTTLEFVPLFGGPTDPPVLTADYAPVLTSFPMTDVVTVFQQGPIVFDLDVDNNEKLGDPADGADRYLPGEELGVKKLIRDPNKRQWHETVFQFQDMNLIVQGLPPNARRAHFRIETVTSFDGYCQNKSDVRIEGETRDEDYSFRRTFNQREESARVREGQAIAPFFCKDYGGFAEVSVRFEGEGHLPPPMRLRIPADYNKNGEGDLAADLWQAAERDSWFDQYGELRPIDDFNLDRDMEHLDPDRAKSDVLVAQKSAGDFLIGLDEYRGVIVDGGGQDGSAEAGHRRLSLSRKELLVEVDVTQRLDNTLGSAPDLPADGRDFANHIMKGVSKIYSETSRGAGVHVYYVVDRVGAPERRGSLGDRAGIARFLSTNVDTTLIDRWAYIVLAHSEGGAFPSFGGGVTVDSRNARFIASVIFVADTLGLFRSLAPKADELVMAVTAHELMHQILRVEDRENVWREEHTLNPDGDGDRSEADPQDQTDLMYDRVVAPRLQLGTIRIWPVVQREMDVKDGPHTGNPNM